jgi:hypothetical protein
MRKLASVRRVGKVEPIEGADRIELVHIDGWQVVSKKGELKEGDLCVYFEIDSKLPATQWSDFMKDRGYKVKTIKLRGQVSQGLALPMSLFERTYAEGEDLTEELGVKLIGWQEKDDQEYQKRAKKVRSWWQRIWPFSLLWKKKYRGFPMYLRKTDEERVQNIRDLGRMLEGRMIYVSEKLDGQSVTIFYNRKERSGLFKRGVFAVCSRNVAYWERANNNWWFIADKYALPIKLKRFCEFYGRSLAIQGEIVGPGIQGNKLRLPVTELRVFGVWDIEAQRYCNLEEKAKIAMHLNLHLVPFVAMIDTRGRKDTVEAYVEMADGYSKINPEVLREGIVVRDVEDDHCSFKAISNKFLLEYDHGGR